MNLFERLKKSFVTDVKDTSKLSNDPHAEPENKMLSDDPYQSGTIIINQNNDINYDFSYNVKDQFWYQNQIIENYRELAGHPEINNGINIIINEMCFTLDPDVMKIDIDEENEKISELINETFKEVLDIINIKENIFSMARQMYVDGQLNVALAYNKSNITKGISSAYIVDPINLYFDQQDRLWKHTECQQDNFLYGSVIEDIEKQEYTESEFVHVDYGLYKTITSSETRYKVNLGYLENLTKIANMLDTLENMLVPFRYSRSVSRRLFNIDVADLPPKQAKEVMNTIKSEFKYKKEFDLKTGSITNLKNTQPLVEDYWMSNRGGAKGTTVDIMDERGAALDLEDIKHAARKLYAAMQIPDEFNPYSEDPGSFSFDSTDITQSLLRFYIYISRLRIPLTALIKEILRRQLVAKGVFKDTEWKDYKKKITISFTAESTFIENMHKELFLKGVDSFVNIKDNIGESISLETAVKMSYGWSTEQLKDELDKIMEEKNNPEYKNFYDRDEERDAAAGWRT